MVPWYNFVQPDGVEPEMWIGPYEHYVEGRGFGPTSIERAMTHTLMLQLDHERRFAVSQLGLDCSNFETEHCENVARAIDCAIDCFELHQTGTKTGRTIEHDDDLIGLNYTPVPPNYMSTLSDMLFCCDDASISKCSRIVEQSTKSPSPSQSQSLPDFKRKSMSVSSAILVDDTDVDGEAQAILVETARRICTEQYKLSEKRPRQYVAKRARKPALQTASEVQHRGIKKRR